MPIQAGSSFSQCQRDALPRESFPNAKGIPSGRDAFGMDWHGKGVPGTFGIVRTVIFGISLMGMILVFSN